MDKCGCGKDGVYQIGHGEEAAFSCNKRKRCPSYEALKAEKKALQDVAYLADGMFDSEAGQNFGDAKTWKHKLHQATDDYWAFYT